MVQVVDDVEIIERVAALDIGKAEVVCCVRIPDESRSGRPSTSSRLGRWRPSNSRAPGTAPWALHCCQWRFAEHVD